MEPANTLPIAWGDLLDRIDQAIQQDTRVRPGLQTEAQDAAAPDDLERLIADLENQIARAESELAGQDEPTLTQELDCLLDEQCRIQAVLDQARALGWPRIQADSDQSAADLAGLESPETLAAARDVLADLNRQAQDLLAAKAQAEQQHRDHQEHLRRLEGEEKTLTQREAAATAALDQLAQRQRRRELRQECLETARQIATLRETLRQKVLQAKRA